MPVKLWRRAVEAEQVATTGQVGADQRLAGDLAVGSRGPADRRRSLDAGTDARRSGAVEGTGVRGAWACRAWPACGRWRPGRTTPDASPTPMSWAAARTPCRLAPWQVTQAILEQSCWPVRSSADCDSIGDRDLRRGVSVAARPPATLQRRPPAAPLPTNVVDRPPLATCRSPGSAEIHRTGPFSTELVMNASASING